MTRPLRTQVLSACEIIRIARAALPSVRALSAFAVSIVAHLTDGVPFGFSLPRLNRRAVELGAAARPKVVDLDLYRRLAGRDNRRVWRLWRRRRAHSD